MTGNSVFLNSSTGAKKPALELAELVGSLSYALDMTEGQPEGHCLRCCWIGTQIGERLGLPERQLNDLYFTLLLKDLGCSSNAARICELYLTDDLAFKRDHKFIDGSMSAALRFVLAKTGLEAGLVDRVRAIVRILQNGGDISRQLIETRCNRGADIASKLEFSEGIQDGIRYLDEHWDGTGKPGGRVSDGIPVVSNIALLAQVVDVFQMEQGSLAALREVQRRNGSWFSPQLVQAFIQVQSRPQFWQDLRRDDLAETVYEMKPMQKSITVDETYLDNVASAFSDIVDAKSSFTADHSNRVTQYSDQIAERLGLTAAHRRWLRRAALLHDIGKLSVSNQILDKPGKLNEEEWKAVRLHPLHSERILARVSAFADIAPVAGAHHERLDGKGYPYGMKGQAVCLEARILAVADVFDALTADRPYRPAMPINDALSILRADSGTAFDGECVSALTHSLQKNPITLAA